MDTFFQKGQILNLPDLAHKLSACSPYYIVQDVFQGGMGACVKIVGEDKVPYALKIILSSKIENESASIRYIEELKTWLTLSSCNGVVEAIVITKVNEIPCIVAKWMYNGDLISHILSNDSTLFYKTFDRIISTLNWAYSKYQIIHRDLKPANILLDEDNNAYISDWGLARLTSKPYNEVLNRNDGNGRVDLTVEGSFLGTIVYASPEQIQGLPNIDHRSDIYSLGCMMYEWETGELPFVGKTIQEIATKQLFEQPKKVGGVFKTTKFKVGSIIAKCLEKKPEKRYQTYDELLTDFRNVAKKHSTFEPFVVTERYMMPFIGDNEMVNDKELFNKIGGSISKDGKFAIVELNKIEPYLKEGISLAAIGKDEEAIKIWRKIFVKSIVVNCAENPLIQLVANNYSSSLYKLGKIDEAISVITMIDASSKKIPEYYVNLSLFHIAKRQYKEAEEVCHEGLINYPNDTDIIGNLTIALTNQNKFQDAINSAYRRLQLSRDVHSLEEAAAVLNRYAEELKNTNFPEAIKNYRNSLNFLYEAKQLNPKFYSARCSISNTLFMLKRYEESVQEAIDIINSKPHPSVVQLCVFYIARSFFWYAPVKECADFCDKWLKQYPTDIQLKRIKYQLMISEYNTSNDEIISFFGNLTKDDKRRLPSDFDNLARAYILINRDESDIDRAFEALEKGLSYYPSYWKYDFSLGSLYRGYGMMEKSLNSFKSAQTKAPWREYIYNQISSIYEQLGDSDKASYYLSEFKRIKSYKEQIYSAK